MQVQFYQTLIRLLAIVSSVVNDDIIIEAESYILRFLIPLLGKQEKKRILDDFALELNHFNDELSEKRVAANSVKLIRIANELKSDLSLAERRLLIIRVSEFACGISTDSSQVFEYINMLGDVFGLTELELDRIFQACYYNGKEPYFFYLGVSDLFCRIVSPEIVKLLRDYNRGLIFWFPPSGLLDLKSGDCIDFQQALKLSGLNDSMFVLSVRELKVNLPKGKCLFENLDIDFTAPSLIAIMGSSGAGKSTFLKALAGVLPLAEGNVFSDKESLNFGMMPQEDNVVSELSVFSQLQEINKIYNVGKSQEEILQVLSSVDLLENAAVCPGDICNSALSGGERKRLGLACVLMTEPDVLLCDEPSSGLSAQDTERLVVSLRSYADRGKLVVASLHQPEINLLRYFNQILYFDEGGHPVYFGSPDGFYSYVAKVTGRFQSGVGLIKSLQNDLSKTEAIIRKTDDRAHRKYPPAYWSQRYAMAEKTNTGFNKLKIERKMLNVFRSFVWDIKSVLARPVFALMLVLYAPIMALLLGSVSRYSPGGHYVSAQNVHFPVFVLMSIVVAVFGGLVFSVSEIGRLQSQRKREIITEGNNRRFFVVKILRFFLLAFLHAAMFSSISLQLLSMGYMFWSLFLIYFLLMFLSSLLGMIVSIISKGKSWAYIMIPVLIVPQLIFSGGLIPWSEFPLWERNDSAPVVSRFIPSALAFEGLMSESVLKTPEYNWEEERIYYLSLVYLHEIIPSYESMLEKDDSVFYRSALMRSLPDELQDCFETEGVAGLKQVFALSLNESTVKKRQLPIVWKFLQNYTCNTEVVWNKKGVYSGRYAFYQLGNWQNDKSAQCIVLGFCFSHFQMVVLFLIFMCMPLLLLLLLDPWKWPH